MKTISSIFLVSLLMLLAGCSNTRFLTNDQLLYTGREKIEILNPQKVPKISPVKNQVNSITILFSGDGFFLQSDFGSIISGKTMNQRKSATGCTKPSPPPLFLFLM